MGDCRSQIGVLLSLSALASLAAAPVPKARVEEIYRTKCEKCHGPEGRAKEKGAGMSFADGEWTHGRDLKSIVAVITNGAPETGMSAFKQQITPQEIQAIAKYVRALDKTSKK